MAPVQTVIASTTTVLPVHAPKLNPGGQVTKFRHGSNPYHSVAAAMQRLSKAKEEGWGVPLFEVTDDASWNANFGGDVPGVGLYVMQDSIDKRPEAVQALVTGIVKASDFIRQTTPGDIVSLIEEEYLPGYGRQLSIDSVSVFKKIWSGDNLITPQHYARLMDVMGGRQITPQEMKQVPYEKMVNMSFVKRARGLA